MRVAPDVAPLLLPRFVGSLMATVAVAVAVTVMAALVAPAVAAAAGATRAAAGSLVVATQAEVLDQLGHQLEKTDRAVGDTQYLLRRSGDAPYLPDLYMRLAELYVQRSRLEHARASATVDAGEAEAGNALAVRVQLSKKLAMETYDKLLADFPDYERRDQAYFFKAHEARELGDWALVQREYASLMERYPRSPWATQARLIQGDHALAEGRIDEAEHLYLAALTAPESAASSPARYKLAWLRMRQENFKEALELFTETITKSQPAAVDIRRAALLALTWPFSEVRRAATALVSLRPLADSQAIYLEALHKLAQRYAVKARLPAARLVWREILRLQPQAEENVDLVVSLVNTSQTDPDPPEQRYAAVDADVRSLATTYWAVHDRPAPVRDRPGAIALDLPALQQSLEQHSRAMATAAQTQAQRQNDPVLEGRAADAYEAYLDAFGHARGATAMQHNRAGALYDAGRYLASAEAFEAAARRPDGEASGREAEVYSALVAYWHALDADARAREASHARSGTLDPLQLLRAREGLRALGAFYIGAYPRGTHLPEVRFNVARIVYQQGELERAVPLLAAFVASYGSLPEAAIAGRLALDALYKLEALSELATLGETFAHDGRLVDAAFRVEAGRLAVAARRRQVELAVVRTTEADFAETMQAGAALHRGSREGEAYLYAAFSTYRSQKDAAAMQNFGDQLLAGYPNSVHGPEVLSSQAAQAAVIADYARAAGLYEAYGRRFARDAGAREALRSALSLRLALGEPTAAQANLAALQALGSEDSEAQGRIWGHFAATGSWGPLAAATAAAAAARQPLACFYAGLSAYAAGEAGTARAHFICAARGPLPPALQARAAFVGAQLQQQAYLALQFGAAAEAEVLLRRKLAALGETEAAFVAVLKLGDPLWGLAASQALAGLYRSFAAFLVTAPVPAGIAPASYRAALQEQADPYLDRARQTLGACAAKATELRLVSPFGRACLGGREPSAEELAGTLRLREAATPAADAAYSQDLARLRGPLLRAPKDLAALQALLRRALMASDFSFSRLLVDRLEEVGADPGIIATWRGLLLWYLGDLTGAAAQLEVGQRAGNVVAATNLAGLYLTYGLRTAARPLLPTADQLRPLLQDPVALHPQTRQQLQGKEAP